MTAHEVLTSLFLLVAGGYLLFVAWFLWSWFRAARSDRQARSDARAEAGIRADSRG